MSPISSRNSVPPFGQLEPPLLARLGAGERALLVAEQLRLDQAVGQRRAAHLDERLLRAQRAVVDRVRDQLLAGARLAADQRGRVGAGDLGDLLEDLPHRTAAADQVREVVALAQLLPQVRVLVDQRPLVLLDQAVNLHRLRDHRRDDAEELGAALEVALGLVLEIDGQRADRAAVQADRHADEAQLLVRQLGPPRRAVQERRLAADVRHDDRLAALHDLAGDALADAIADQARAVADAVGGLDAQVAVLLENRDDAADGAVMAREDLEDAVERRLQVQRARQRLADFEQGREAARFAGRGVHVGRRRQRPRTPERSWWSHGLHPTILSLSAIYQTFVLRSRNQRFRASGR